MKEIQVTTTVRVNEGGEITAETTQAAELPEKENCAAAGMEREITEEQEERYSIVSDLADICDYLEDSEVIKIKLIINKAQARRRRETEE